MSETASPTAVTAGPTVTASDGTRVATWDFGGEGPPLVFLHATGFHGRCYVPLASALASSFHCYAVDQRGHGRSDLSATGSYDWRLFRDDLLAVLDRLGLDQPFAFGHSLGGGVAFLAEGAHPGIFQGIYAYEPIVFTPEQVNAIRSNNGLVGVSRRRRPAFPSLGEAMLNYAGKPPFGGFRAEVLWQYVTGGFDVGDDGTATLHCTPEHEARVYEHAASSGAYNLLGAVQARVALACGADNPDIGLGHLNVLAAAVHVVDVEEIAGLSHFGPFEDPARVAGRVVAMLNRAPGSGPSGPERGKGPSGRERGNGPSGRERGNGPSIRSAVTGRG